MKTQTARKEARLEKKKKKIAALAEVMKLNDRDGRTNKIRTHSESSTSSSTIDTSESRKKIEEASETTDLARKRSKVEEEERASKKAKLNDKTIQKSEENSEIGGDPILLSESQYAQLKRELNARKRAVTRVPKLRFKEQGLQAGLDVKHDERTPIFLTDIQHLLMVALFGNESPCSPWRWCHLEKTKRLAHTVVLVIEGLSMYHFVSNESKFIETARLFEHKFDVVMPPFKEGKILEQLAVVPLSSSEKDTLVEQYGSLEAAIEANKESSLLINTVFPIEKQTNESQEVTTSTDDSPTNESTELSTKPGDRFPRTQLLLSALQMIDEGYPLPLRGKLANMYKGYKLTKDIYAEVTPKSPMYGVDCEMCRTIKGGVELTRISIVDEDLNPIYESLVLPSNQIVDYLTQYSGITPEMMLDATKNLGDVQSDISNLLPPDAILVGQSLNSDLTAMRMMHPYVIDTSVIFNLSGQRKIKSKLSTLANEFLGEIIQQGDDGHNPIEDSSASMKLVKLKLANSLDYGDAVLSGRRKHNEVYGSAAHRSSDQPAETVSHNLFGHIVKQERSSAIVTNADVQLDLQKMLSLNENNGSTKSVPSINCYQTDGNKATVRKMRELIPNYAMTMASLSVTPQYLEESRLEKTISNVDKWISRVHDSVAPNGLFIVLFGGTPTSSSGVAMVKIKKGEADVADTPITL